MYKLIYNVYHMGSNDQFFIDVIFTLISFNRYKCCGIIPALKCTEIILFLLKTTMLNYRFRSMYGRNLSWNPGSWWQCDSPNEHRDCPPPISLLMSKNCVICPRLDRSLAKENDLHQGWHMKTSKSKRRGWWVMRK